MACRQSERLAENKARTLNRTEKHAVAPAPCHGLACAQALTYVRRHWHRCASKRTRAVVHIRTDAVPLPLMYSYVHMHTHRFKRLLDSIDSIDS